MGEKIISTGDVYHEADYSKVCCTGAVGLMSKLLHRSIEKFGITGFSRKLSKRRDLLKVLEVGAGGGQHAKYVEHHFDQLLMCDLRSEHIPEASSDAKFQKEYRSVNAENLPYEKDSFDRLVATCLLAHLSNPETALEEWKRVVREGGVISIFVPCEPGLLLRIVQSLTTRRKQKKLGYDGWLLHYREHRNHHPGMMKFIQNTFGSNVKARNYPFPFLSWNFNLWTIIQIESLDKSNGK